MILSLTKCTYTGSNFLNYKIDMCFLKMLNTDTYDSAISHLGIYPREMKTYVYAKTYTRMFIAALFIIARVETMQMSIN